MTFAASQRRLPLGMVPAAAFMPYTLYDGNGPACQQRSLDPLVVEIGPIQGGIPNRPGIGFNGVRF